MRTWGFHGGSSIAEWYDPRQGPSTSGCHVNIFHSEEDGGYIADIPDPESCSAFGETAAAAPAEVEAARDAGSPISEPR